MMTTKVSLIRILPTKYSNNFRILAWADFNHREVIESGSTSEATAMDTGNPWDSKPLAASPTETTIENAFSAQNPKVDEGWADFTNNKDPTSPTKAKPTEET